jgi:cyclopropane fatty-acyl-phospholipid synthase-like methyltransferase
MKTVLDFGAGWKAIHTAAMRALGVQVTAWDVGRNFDPYVHADNALTREYDVVMASNVINTHATPHALASTLRHMSLATKPDGVCVCNYPASPRKGEWTNAQMLEWLRDYFWSVEVKSCKGTVVFFCRQPRVATVGDDKLTAEELKTCTIRPVGAVGSKALVPRIVLSMLGAEEGAL